MKLQVLLLPSRSTGASQQQQGQRQQTLPKWTDLQEVLRGLMAVSRQPELQAGVHQSGQGHNDFAPRQSVDTLENRVILLRGQSGECKAMAIPVDVWMRGHFDPSGRGASVIGTSGDPASQEKLQQQHLQLIDGRMEALQTRQLQLPPPDASHVLFPLDATNAARIRPAGVYMRTDDSETPAGLQVFVDGAWRPLQPSLTAPPEGSTSPALTTLMRVLMPPPSAASLHHHGQEEEVPPPVATAVLLAPGRGGISISNFVPLQLSP